MEARLPTPPTSVGDYTLGPLLGRGGMSEVYAATHPVLGDRLALKLLRDAADGAFHVEARTREVRHPNVVRVLDAGHDAATDRYFLVMERIDGGDLAAHVARGPLDEHTARTLFAAIADGMHAVHAAGIVHRDLKPANVLLHAGTPRIADFGIAKVLGDNAALVTSRRIGTLAYMAPEQLVGGRIAPSVDVWALGVMLFEAVTGQLPFAGFTDTYTPQLVETAPRVRSLVAVSATYDALVARCLDGDPARRPSMDVIARVLRDEIALDAAGLDPGVADERITQDIGAAPQPGAPPHGAPLAREVGDRRAGPAYVEHRLGVLGAPGRSRPRRRARTHAWLALGALAIGGVAIAATTRAGCAAREDDAVVATSTRSAPPASTPSAATASAATASAATPPAATPPAATPPASAPTSPLPAPAASPPSSPPATTPAAALPAAAPPSAATPAAPTSTLVVDVRTQPRGARIFIAGKARGTTPARLELAGPTEIVLRRDGYRSARVQATQAGALDVQLAPTTRAKQRTRPVAGTRRETLD